MYFHINARRRAFRPGLLAACVAALSAGTAMAQEPMTQDDDEEIIDVIAVTGSRIAKSNIDTPIPTQVLDVGEIEAAGTIDVGEIAEQIPGVYFGISPNSSLLSTQNAGLTTIDLRALGTNRTLTLINGRRVVSNSGSAQRVDTGTIPSAFVERIEITTGGASAIYGSDAIAGVANIILQKSFTGLKLDARGEVTGEGGGEQTALDAGWGVDFGGRGNFMIGAMYEDREPIFASERDYARSDLEMDITTGELEVNRSSYLPGGRFEGDAWNIGGVWQNDQPGYCIDDGRVPACDDYQEALDGYDFRPFSMVVPERTRWGALAQLSYDLTDTVRGAIRIQYSDIETRAQRAAALAQDASTYGPFDDEVRIGDMPADHPFIHPAVLETLSGTVDWRRRFNEVGQRYRASIRETLRSSVELDGEIGDNWTWSAYAGFGRHEQNQVRENELNKQKIDFALDIEADPDNPGEYRCIDAAARADGCVPLNVFGEGSVSEAAADYIRATDVLYQQMDQTTASVVLNGAIGRFPAADSESQVAVGIDYRKEEQFTRGDEATNAGLTTTGFIPDIEGEFDVTEAFVEFNLPLVSGKQGVYALDLATAYRFADYSTIGNVSSWNFGLSYAPAESIRFRGQISQAQRAPDLTELFSSQRSDFDGVNDPCDGVTAATTGVVADNCRSVAGILAAINDPMGTGAFEQAGSSIFGPNVGNPNLMEETAETVTYGFVFTPTAVDGLSIIADYYDIEVEDAIASVDSQLAADLCYTDPTFNNRFCDSITRDVDGQIARIVNQVENVNVLISEGIDVSANYRFAFDGLAGEFDAQLLYTHVLANEERFNGPDGEEVDDFAGIVGLPEDEYRFTLRWGTDDVSVRYRLNYTGTVVDDNDPDPADVAGGDKFEHTVVHDLYASYQFGSDDRYRVYGGVNNITDDHGPYLPDGYVHGHNSNVHASYDRTGRRFYIGFGVDLD
ncbi:MAG: TonB-dependent receptor [Proteobacteria bacterium]|nr:TonB-dependent receptor [Pseudomonadota bacterium]